MSFKLLKSTLIISTMTTISRIFGLIRDIVIGANFGPGLGIDVFIVSFRIPNFLRRLFAEGGFSQAFVPVLSEYKEKRKNLLKFTKHQSKIVADECSAKLDYLDAYYNFEFQEYNQTIKLTNKIIDSYSMEFDWLLGLSYLLRAKTYIEINEISKAKEDLKVVSKMDFKFPEIEQAESLLNRISAK